MRGLKSSCKDLANASGVRVRQGFGQPNIRLLLRGKVYLAFGNTSTSGLWTSSQG